MSTHQPDGSRFTTRHLADGREIIYVDEPGTPERTAEDPRPVEPRVQSGELRHDALVDDWVAVAAHRQHRTFMPPKDECPLCPAGHGSVPSEIPERDYQVVVFENRFPSYAVTAVGADAPDPSGIFGTRPAVGPLRGRVLHERPRGVVQGPARRAGAHRHRHVGPAHRGPGRPARRSSRSSPSRTAARRSASRCPTRTARSTPTPTCPTARRPLLEAARRHHERTGRLLGADILAAERADGSRVVVSGTHWTAYVPFAARWPVEVHLAPHRDVPDLAALDDDERDELAVIYRDLLGRLDRYYVDEDGAPVKLPYIAAWQQAPAKTGATSRGCTCSSCRCCAGPGKLKFLAGSESGRRRLGQRRRPGAGRGSTAGGRPVSDTHSPPRSSRRWPAAFERTFGSAPTGVWSAPGRVNLIGEHTDYNGGLCLPIALPQRTYAAVSRRDDGVVRMASAQQDGVVEVALDDISPEQPGGWGCLRRRRAVGAAAGRPDRRRVSTSIVDSTVPFGAGPVELGRPRVRRRRSGERPLRPRPARVRRGPGAARRALCRGRERHRRRPDRRHGPVGVAALRRGRAPSCSTAGRARRGTCRSTSTPRATSCSSSTPGPSTPSSTASTPPAATRARRPRRASASRRCARSTRPGSTRALDRLGSDEVRRRVRHVVTEIERVDPRGGGPRGR